MVLHRLVDGATNATNFNAQVAIPNILRGGSSLAWIRFHLVHVKAVLVLSDFAGNRLACWKKE